MNVFAHLSFHFGTENTVLLAQLQLSMIQRKNNATTALKDSSEITTATHVSQGSDIVIFIAVYFKTFLLFYSLINPKFKLRFQ
jgi:hypothetical protein